MLEKIIFFIVRNKKLVIVLLLLLLVVSILSSKTIVVVSLEGADANTPIQFINSQNPSDETSIKPGLNILGTGQYILRAHSSSSETWLSVDAKPFRINKAALKLKPQLAAQKVAREAGDCPIGDPNQMRTGDVFSYICTNPQHIFKSSFGDMPLKDILIKDVNLLSPTAHLNGVVHFIAGAHDVGTIIEFISASGKQTIARYSVDYSPKNHLAKSNNGKLYILDTVKKQLEIYSGPSFTKQTVNLTVPEENWDADNISFDAHNNTLFVFGALTEDGDESLEPNYSRGELFVFDLSSVSEKESPNITYSVGKDKADTLLGFIAVDDSTLAARSHENAAIVYDLQGGIVEEIDRFPAINGMAAAKEVLYILISGDIYSYVPADHSLYLAFDSKKITVSSLRPVNNELLFNGFSESESNPENQTYLLNPGSTASKKRTEDFLPYGDLELPVRWMDYKGNKIYVKLLLESIGFQRDGQVFFDQSEFEENKKAVLDQLAKDGYNTTQYNINFTH